jgi:hypothetical protein
MSSAWGSSRTWCIGHVARMVNVRNFCEIWVEKPGGKKPLGRPRLWWSIIATLILGKLYYRVWIGLIWLRIRTGRNSYKNQRHYQLINKFVLRFFFFFFFACLSLRCHLFRAALNFKCVRNCFLLFLCYCSLPSTVQEPTWAPLDTMSAGPLVTSGIQFFTATETRLHNRSIFVTVKCCVFFAVRTEFLNII